MLPLVRHLGIVLAASAVALGIAACGGKIAADGPDADGEGPSPTATAPTGTATGTTTDPEPVPTSTPKDTVWCGMPTGASLPYGNAAQLRDLLVGRWIYCEGVGRVGPADVVGFEIDKDHFWWYLRRAPDGSLVRAAGTGYEGYCWVIDLGHGTYQVDLDVDVGGGALVTQTEFTDGPRRVHLHHRDGYAAYLRIPD
jgi:hypothetical protein